jgi:hypothetical protein
MYLVASEGYCISCGKPFRADFLGSCLIWLRQNLSFVIIPLKIACITSKMSPWEKIEVPSIKTMDLKSWRRYVIPPSVCFAVLVFPPLLLACATTVFILKPLWRSCLLLFFSTHKPCTVPYACLTVSSARSILSLDRITGASKESGSRHWSVIAYIGLATAVVLVRLFVTIFVT